MDFTNPRAVEWWHGQLDKTRQGRIVRSFKADDGEGTFVGNAVFHDGSRAAEMKNRYAELYLGDLQSYIDSRLHGDGLLLARPGFTATHRYPFSWSGDNEADFSYANGLPSVIIAAHTTSMKPHCLRKAVEDTAKRFLDRDNAVDPTKGFTSLSADLRADLRAARKRILGELPVALYEKVLRNTPEAHRELLVSPNDNDIDSNGSLDAATKGILRLQRRRLRLLVSDKHIECFRNILLIDEVLSCTERVLNPSAHSGATPLYEKEVQDALALIEQLDTDLAP